MKIFKIFYLVLIFINIDAVYNNNSTQCGTDKLKIKPRMINIENKVKISSISKETSDPYTPISIGYDFTTLEMPYTMSSSTFYKIRSILKDTREEFSKILQIQHKSIDLSDDLNDIMEACELSTIGEDYPNFLMKNDLIIFPMFEKLEPGVLAAASPCLIGQNNHPYGGILYINSDLDFGKINTELYIKNLFFHEITHILAFHPYFFEKLHMMERSGTLYYITSKKVIEKAKEHFNCNTLTQIQLENQGGEGSAGSHWESRYMLGDYMISTDYPDVAISDITLALFEDTHFYKVNYYSGGLFKFGKNKGCGFFNTKCIINEKAVFDDFCDVEDKPLCSSSRALKSSCFLVYHLYNIPSQYQYFSDKTRGGFPTASYCPVPYDSYTSSYYYYPNHCQVGFSQLPDDYGEIIGNQSFCFMSSLLPNNSTEILTSNIPICYEIECNTTKKRIILKIGSENVTCPTNGGIVSKVPGFNGTLECPKYNDICLENDTFVCNEMYSCFTALANKNNYSYEIDYYDFNGDPAEISYNNETNEVIYPIKLTGYNIKLNIKLLIFSLFMLFI